jgi:hypothetical protein
VLKLEQADFPCPEVKSMSLMTDAEWICNNITRIFVGMFFFLVTHTVFKKRFVHGKGLVCPPFAECCMWVWGEVSFCDAPPTLIILHVWSKALLYCCTSITTDNWLQATGNCYCLVKAYNWSQYYYIESETIEIDVVMDVKSTSRFLDTDTCRLLLMWKVPTSPHPRRWLLRG